MLKPNLEQKSFHWWIVITSSSETDTYGIYILPGIREYSLSHASVESSDLKVQGIKKPLHQKTNRGSLYVAKDKTLAWGEHLAATIQNLANLSHLSLADALILLQTSKGIMPIWQDITETDSNIRVSLPYGSAVIGRRDALISTSKDKNEKFKGLIQRNPSPDRERDAQDGFYYKLNDRNKLSLSEMWSSLFSVASSFMSYFLHHQSESNSVTNERLPLVFNDLTREAATGGYKYRKHLEGSQNDRAYSDKEWATLNYFKSCIGKSVDAIFKSGDENLWQRVLDLVLDSNTTSATNKIAAEAQCVMSVSIANSDMLKFIKNESLNSSVLNSSVSNLMMGSNNKRFSQDDITRMLAPRDKKNRSSTSNLSRSESLCAAYEYLSSLHSLTSIASQFKVNDIVRELSSLFEYENGAGIVTHRTTDPKRKAVDQERRGSHAYMYARRTTNFATNPRAGGYPLERLVMLNGIEIPRDMDNLEGADLEMDTRNRGLTSILEPNMKRMSDDLDKFMRRSLALGLVPDYERELQARLERAREERTLLFD